MWTLNFPSGMQQQYPDGQSMLNAARIMGGEAIQVSNRIYAFCKK